MANAEDSLPATSPDEAEQHLGRDLDNIVPTFGYERLPMVGLGGSAGSIAALQTFFQQMPADSGLVFVVVLHLSPEHESTLPELLQRHTSMPVISAADGVKVQADSVYVIPPGKFLASADGRLRLTDFHVERGKRVAVDLFFRTLADTHGPHSAAIVLSGVDGDGAIGIKRIKERGGLTIAQDPSEAEHTGMPRAAIGTGMVDWVLQVAEIPKRLLNYFELERKLKLPPEDGPQPALPPKAAPEESEAALRDILTFLRTRTGRDFSYYKRATILRRISRRMQVNGLDDLPTYLAYLRTHPWESGALLQDLLISVTNFFRDRESFEALERHIPALFQGKGPGDVVRVWVAACATGEEAYSIAMLLHEHARQLDAPPLLQIFATDLDEHVIQTAREGVYPETIAADVSEERLRRFFVKEHHGYRVRREIRETVLFALHDLLKDSPFSRLDLVSCRNLLIYLNREAQQRAVSIFHFALNASGWLFLGTSESIDDDSPMFTIRDKKHRLFTPRPTARFGLPLPSGPGTLARSLELQARARERPAPSSDAGGPALNLALHLPRPGPADERGASWGELHFKLIEHFAPPSVLVNHEYEIMHLSANAGRFLHFAGGEPSRNLLRAVDPMLRIELRAALYQAAQAGAPVEVRDVPLERDGERSLLHLRIAPLQELESDFFVVTFDEHRPDDARLVARANHEGDSVARRLEQELEHLKSQFRDIVEESEASTEELKASNEELRAMNEELRSATEELETSREELQSINEELTTVNQELKIKVDELGQANSDLHNLMASTAIATIFLDRDLCITRYTPTAVELFNLIPTDIGRPLSDLSSRVDYPQMERDAAQALAHLTPTEREVRAEGHWYLARTRPYRTTEDRIAGVVLTFIEVTARKSAEERYRLLLENFRDYAIISTDIHGTIVSWNAGARTTFGYSAEEAIGRNSAILFVPEDRAAGKQLKEFEIAEAEGRGGGDRWMARKDGSRFWAAGETYSMRDPDGGLIGFTKVCRDLTERKLFEEELQTARHEAERRAREAETLASRLENLMENVPEGIALTDGPPDFPLVVCSRTAKEMLGGEIDALTGMSIHGPDGHAVLYAADGVTIPRLEDTPLFRAAHRGETVKDEEWMIERSDGTRMNVLAGASPILDARGAVQGAVLCWRDVTEARRKEHLLNVVHEMLAVQRERQRLAHRLHDELQQVLFAAQLHLGALQDKEQDATNLAIFAKIQGMLKEASQEARDLAVELRPPVLYQVGLAAAFEWLTHWARDKYGLEVQLEIGPDFPNPEEHMALLLFDAVRELLFNVMKHAQTTSAAITAKRVANQLVIVVRDEGRGIDEQSPPPDGFGIAGIRHRIHTAGGTFAMQSAAGRGVTTTIRVPIELQR